MLSVVARKNIDSCLLFAKKALAIPNYVAFSRWLRLAEREIPENSKADLKAFKEETSKKLNRTVGSLNRDLRIGEMLRKEQALYALFTLPENEFLRSSQGLLIELVARANTPGHRLQRTREVIARNRTRNPKPVQKKKSLPKHGDDMATPHITLKEVPSIVNSNKELILEIQALRSHLAERTAWFQNMEQGLLLMRREVDDLKKLIEKTSVLAIGGRATIIPRAEVKETSAKDIARTFSQEHADGVIFNINDITEIGNHLRIIGDKNFTVWSSMATEAHGDTGGGHWRFNKAAVSAIRGVLYLINDEHNKPQLRLAGVPKKKAAIKAALMRTLPIGQADGPRALSIKEAITEGAILEEIAASMADAETVAPDHKSNGSHKLVGRYNKHLEKKRTTPPVS